MRVVTFYCNRPSTAIEGNVESLQDSRDSISAENISTANTVDSILRTVIFSSRS